MALTLASLARSWAPMKFGKAMQEPSLRETMEKQNFSTDTYEDQAAFQASMARESAYIKQIASKIDMKK